MLDRKNFPIKVGALTHLFKSKEAGLGEPTSSEKVFLLLMGCSKNYIMYWGLRVLL